MSLIKCPIYHYAQKSPQNPAVIDHNQILSYQAFEAKVERCQHLLIDHIKPYSRVAIFAENSADYIAVLFAIWRIQAVACPLNTRNPIKTIEQQIKQINATLIISENQEILKSKIISIPKISLSELFKSCTDYKSFKPTYKSSQAATILFTSGSTHKPKAALHSIDNHLMNARGSNENIKLTKKDRWLLSLPLYHVSGLGILFRSFLAGSAVVIFNSKMKLNSSILDYSITHLSLVTPQLQQLLQSRLKFPKLKAVLIGGSSISKPLIRAALDKKLPIHISYGLTEMASQVATSAKLHSISSYPQAEILKYRQVKISPENEILVKGKTLFQGYVEGNRTFKPFDREGWFHTGDLGEIHKQTYLHVIGRKDNMFISGGENIQPEEIEKYIQEIHGISACIVIPIKDKRFGFRPAAIIKWQNKTLKPSPIIRHLKTKLPKYKIPTKFITWPSNLSCNLKINRQELKKILRLT